MNMIGLLSPSCKQPKRFRAHKRQIQDHFAKPQYMQDYGEEIE